MGIIHEQSSRIHWENGRSRFAIAALADYAVRGPLRAATRRGTTTGKGYIKSAIILSLPGVVDALIRSLRLPCPHLLIPIPIYWFSVGALAARSACRGPRAVAAAQMRV